MEGAPKVLVMSRDDFQFRSLKIRIFENSVQVLHDDRGEEIGASSPEPPNPYVEVLQLSCKNPVCSVSKFEDSGDCAN